MKIDYNKITLSVIAGVGGDDAKDWAKMLVKMYYNYALKKKWKVKFIDDNVLEIQGENVYEFLKDENGVHRLVRISPFDSKKLRHTSFALVEILPTFFDEELNRLEIPEKDLKITFFRSSGPGGQNVNKVETAVRIMHLPTGLLASSQSERLQSLNKEKALKILKNKLLNLMEEKKEKLVQNLKTKIKPSWGNEIRSYILYPYKQVKNHRSNFKTNKVEEVLDGNLDLILKK